MYKQNSNIPYNSILAVTNRHLCQRPFLQQIERICQVHPRALILREKDLTEGEYYELAKKVQAICRSYQVDCILHNFPEAAIKLQADKIHLPLWKLQECSSELLSAFSVIGASTHSLEEAQAAWKAGATYLTAGHIYATDCKKGLAPRGLDFLKEICTNIPLPVYGIGGIYLDFSQIQEIKNQGAAGACIMSAIMCMK